MRILSLTAQKPDSTGSGVYLTELVRGFAAQGHVQAVLCGTVAEDEIRLPEGVAVYPVCYQSGQLPFPVCGMSDEMPYTSTRYRDLSEAMTRQLMQAFRSVLRTVVSEFKPHVILCHHLYFLAALAREMFPEIPVYGQCHGSDLRQLATNAWQGDWIKEGIRDLNGIFALHEAQKKQICDMFGLEPHRVTVVGTGYNSNVFFRDEEAKAARDSEKFRYIFAGKLSEKKGVYSLLHCLKHLEKPESVEILLAGGCGSEEELAKLKTMAEQCPCTVTFLGKLDQKTLACRMNQSDAFILPSFYEGLPLVLIEAMACGLRTICTDLPGIKPWLDKALPENGTIFVAPPRMRNTDEPIPESLPDFEKRLARAMDDARQAKLPDEQQVARLSWDALCEKLIQIFRR